MATLYKLVQFGVLIDGATFVPEAPGNRHWDAFVAWLASGNTPDPVTPPDWRPDATADLTARVERLVDVVSGMQADYIAGDDKPNALACRDVKGQLKALPADPTIVAATTRAEFNAARRTRLRAIAAAAPPDVRDALRDAAQA
jgi:hypothetical protein